MAEVREARVLEDQAEMPRLLGDVRAAIGRDDEPGQDALRPVVLLFIRILGGEDALRGTLLTFRLGPCARKAQDIMAGVLDVCASAC